MCRKHLWQTATAVSAREEVFGCVQCCFSCAPLASPHSFVPATFRWQSWLVHSGSSFGHSGPTTFCLSTANLHETNAGTLPPPNLPLLQTNWNLRKPSLIWSRDPFMQSATIQALIIDVIFKMGLGDAQLIPFTLFIETATAESPGLCE